MTPQEELRLLALHALKVLRSFPDGNLSRQEVDTLATTILKYLGHEIPIWRIPV